MTPQGYEVRIRGQVGDALLAAFEDLMVSHQDTQTVVRGQLPDQAALMGLLIRIQALGLEVLEVRRTEEAPRPSRAP